MSAEEIDPVEETEQEPDAWEERVPCPDESCIGTLGSDGRCRVCGQQGEILAASLSRSEAKPASGDDGAISEPPEENAEDLATEYPDEAHDEADSSETDGWEQRRLCPDESCIGTLGADGRCRVCGKPGSTN
ncbi:MAG: hypothetical protein WBG37_07250 [Desulfobacterales bacterium]